MPLLVLWQGCLYNFVRVIVYEIYNKVDKYNYSFCTC